jgi:hypothetical protein
LGARAFGPSSRDQETPQALVDRNGRGGGQPKRGKSDDEEEKRRSLPSKMHLVRRCSEFSRSVRMAHQLVGFCGHRGALQMATLNTLSSLSMLQNPAENPDLEDGIILPKLAGSEDIFAKVCLLWRLCLHKAERHFWANHAIWMCSIVCYINMGGDLVYIPVHWWVFLVEHAAAATVVYVTRLWLVRRPAGHALSPCSCCVLQRAHAYSVAAAR